MEEEASWVCGDEPLAWVLRLPSRGGKLEGDELLESLQVLSVQFDVIVAGPLHPQGLDSTGAALVHGQTMGEVDHLVLGTVDHQHRGRHFGHLVNTGEDKQKGEIQDGHVFNSTVLCTRKHTVRRAFRHKLALKSALMAEQENRDF